METVIKFVLIVVCELALCYYAYWCGKVAGAKEMLTAFEKVLGNDEEAGDD